MEASSERQRYIDNPFRLLRGLADIAIRSLTAVDDALYDFGEARPYNETNYPPILHVEAPVATEEELI